MATPPDFVADQVLTAAQMNAVGLWLIKTETIGSAVATVTVTNAFSADYDNYRVIISKSDCSANNAAVFARLHAGATHDSAFGRVDYTGTASAGAHTNSTSGSYVGFTGSNNDTNLAFDIFGPFLAEYKNYAGHNGSGAFISYTGGVDKSATSRTNLTLTISGAGTLTGGTVRIYGYRD